MKKIEVTPGAISQLNDKVEELNAHLGNYDVTDTRSAGTGFSGSLNFKANTSTKRCLVYGSITTSSAKTKGSVYGLINVPSNDYIPTALVTQVCLAEASNTIYEVMITKNHLNEAMALVPLVNDLPNGATVYVYIEWYYG